MASGDDDVILSRRRRISSYSTAKRRAERAQRRRKIQNALRLALSLCGLALPADRSFSQMPREEIKCPRPGSLRGMLAVFGGTEIGKRVLCSRVGVKLVNLLVPV
jgi:hypothetical protein